VPERSGDFNCDRSLGLVVVVRGAQEIGVGAVVRGDRFWGERLSSWGTSVALSS
jgi:hypothetical protein